MMGFASVGHGAVASRPSGGDFFEPEKQGDV